MRGLGQVLLAVRRDIVSGALPAPMLDGLAYTWINGSIRPSDYIKISGREQNAATRDLRAASRAGYLVSVGATRTRRYLVAEALATLAPIPEA
jgi:hypothetical protein